jgi:P-type conjugative transfer protein TrbJ
LHVPLCQQSAQLIVFDPNNYAQNVLTAARELQQIRQPDHSLHNQAQMLINQAKNLASLPVFLAAAARASIQRTQAAASVRPSRIALRVSSRSIDAFSTTLCVGSRRTSQIKR